MVIHMGEFMSKYQIIDKRGRVVERDENPDGTVPLRDGEALRIPMFMMDSLQRAVFNDARRKKFVKEEFDEDDDKRNAVMQITHDATFTNSRGVTFTDHRIADAQRAVEYLKGRDEALRQMWRDSRAAAEQARQEMIDASSNAWRGDARPAGEHSAHGSTSSATARHERG